MRQRLCHCVLVVLLSLFDGCLLVGCTAAGMGDQISPAMGGLPAGAPERPSTPYQYPAVHDMPPPRPTPALTEEQRTNLQSELTRLRDRQESLNAQAAKPAAKGKSAAKKKPSGQNGTAQAAGAKDSP